MMSPEKSDSKDSATPLNDAAATHEKATLPNNDARHQQGRINPPTDEAAADSASQQQQ